jgi:hypothetical protein
MEAHTSVPAPSGETPRVVPFPYAWYVSGDLIFELFNGGQPAHAYAICWEHLKPITKLTEAPHRPLDNPERACSRARYFHEPFYAKRNSAVQQFVPKIYEFGEERRSRRIARAIVRPRLL